MDNFSKYREGCLFLVKLDFAIFAGAITIASYFELQAEEVLQGLLTTKELVFATSIVLVLGLGFERWLLVQSANEDDTEKQDRQSVAKWGTYVHGVLNLMLFSLILGYAFGFAESRTYSKEHKEEVKLIHFSIRKYFDAYQAVPESWESVSRFVADSLGGDVTQLSEFTYQIKDTLRYEVVFPGVDEAFKTSDDWIYVLRADRDCLLFE